MISHRDEKETDLKHAGVASGWNVACAPVLGKMRDSSLELAFWKDRVQNTAPSFLLLQLCLVGGADCLPTPRLGEAFKVIKRQYKGTVEDMEVKERGIHALVLLPQ